MQVIELQMFYFFLNTQHIINYKKTWINGLFCLERVLSKALGETQWRQQSELEKPWKGEIFKPNDDKFRLPKNAFEINDAALSGLNPMLNDIHWAAPNATDFVLSGLKICTLKQELL